MSNQASLTGLSVLILEDDFYLAEDAKDALEGAGATVLGPFSESEQALAEVGGRGADCALVDVNLGLGPTFEPARRLQQMGVPVVLVTGYDSDVVPPSLAHLPCLQKPTQPQKLVAAVEAACGR